MTERELFPEEQLLRTIFSGVDKNGKEPSFETLWGQEKGRKILHENFGSFLAQLPHKECQVLRLYYGLFDGWKFTPEEIGEKLGLKVEKTNHILKKLMTTLKDPKTKSFLSQE